MNFSESCRASSTRYNACLAVSKTPTSHSSVVTLSSFTPFITENLYQGLRQFLPEEKDSKDDHRSVHFLPFPEVRQEYLDPVIQRQFAALQTVIELTRTIRERNTLPLRVPLKELVIYNADQEYLDDIKALSSYVEEEHHFWYWTTSAWFFCLFVSSSRQQWFSKFIFHPAIMLLLFHRIIRRWNQTGQKYAGAPDIVHSPVLRGPNSIVLWSLIGATYMDITIRLARHVARSIATFDTEQKDRSVEIESTDQNRMFGTIAVLPLCGTALIFKLTFTVKDAPIQSFHRLGHHARNFRSL